MPAKKKAAGRTRKTAGKKATRKAGKAGGKKQTRKKAAKKAAARNRKKAGAGAKPRARRKGDAKGSASAGSDPQQSIEVEFFRMLNRVVEPMVRAGLGSPRIAPSGVIVVEHTGRKTGTVRRSPLAATRLGDFVIVSTFRAKRSQWVRNLEAQPRTHYWLAGRRRDAHALVLVEGKRPRIPKSWPRAMQRVASFLTPYTRAGWAFAILAPD